MTSRKTSKKPRPTSSKSSGGFRTVLVIFLSLLLPGGLLYLLWVKILRNVILAIVFRKMLKAKLKKAGYSDRMSDLVYAQARHETGDFTSRLYREQNNPWGMGCVAKRPTTQSACQNGYGSYKDLADAADDFVLYLNYFNYLPDYSTTHAYVQALAMHGYFTDSPVTYEKGLIAYLPADSPYLA